MNVAMAFLQLGTGCIVAYYEYRRSSISVFLWATLLLMFGFPHCVTVLCGTFDYDPVTMLQASLFVVLFNTAYLVARIITSGGKNQNTLNFREQSEDNQQTLRSTRSLHLVTILCICIFASLFIRVVFAVLFFWRTRSDFLGSILRPSTFAV